MTGEGVIEDVLLGLYEHFADLDDSDEAHFGEYARVRRDQDEKVGERRLIVQHETEPWGIEVIVRPLARPDEIGVAGNSHE